MPGLALGGISPSLPAGSRRRLTALPRDMPWGHAPGPASYRLLLVGGDAVAGYGVGSHTLGLAGCLARSLSGRNGHGADVKLVVGERSAPRDLDGLLRGQRLGGLDGLVLVLDAVRFGWTAPGFGAELRRLVTALADRLPEGSPIIVLPAPAVGRGASLGPVAWLRRYSEVVAAAVRPLASVVVLPDWDSSASPGRDLYRGWADAITDALLPQLREPQVLGTREEDVDEGSRQLAVARLGTLGASWEAEFERFASFARAGYGTRSASLSVVDGLRTRFLARQGIDFEVLRREDTICASVLSSPGGVIVGDARLDPRFRHLPPVEAGDAVFYAGYRVASPDGQPVAVLCVFDPEPRPVLGQDITLLADLAHAAQRRVWELHQTDRG